MHQTRLASSGRRSGPLGCRARSLAPLTGCRSRGSPGSCTYCGCCLRVTSLPPAPRPVSCTVASVRPEDVWSHAAVPRPTRSSGSRVNAEPSISSLALTTRLLPSNLHTQLSGRG